MTEQATLRPAPKKELFWRSPKDWPMEPSGYVFLARAFQTVGHAMFGQEWNNQEAFADKAGQPVYPRGSSVDEIVAISEKHKADNAPYERARAVRREFAKRAQAGELVTAWRKIAGGELIPIPRDHWNTERLEARFHWCQMSPSNPFDNVQYAGPGFGWIFVTADTLDRPVAPQSNASEAEVPASAATTTPEATTSKVPEAFADTARQPSGVERGLPIAKKSGRESERLLKALATLFAPDGIPPLGMTPSMIKRAVDGFHREQSKDNTRSYKEADRRTLNRVVAAARKTKHSASPD